MALRVRELPPLRLSLGVETPSGRRRRWGLDEPQPENVYRDLVFSSTMPGGNEHCTCTLPRQPERDYPDLVPLSTVTVYGAGGDVRGEFRLERSPRVSGDDIAISPAAVGWQAALDDDKTAQALIVDQDVSGWGEASRSWRIGNRTNGYAQETGSVSPDETNALPALELAFTHVSGSAQWAVTSEYDAGPGLKVGSFYVDWVNDANAPPVARVYSSDADDQTGLTTELSAAGAGYHTLAAARRYLFAEARNAGSALTAGTDYAAYLRQLTTYGDHDLTRRGSDPGGFWCSDVEAYLLPLWAPVLNFSTGPDGTIAPSSFIIPQLAWRGNPTTLGRMLRDALRFELRDWAVWENKTYWSNDRGARGRKWRARVRPAQLEETGPQVDRLWDSIAVSYRDVDGTTRIVGPPGSGFDAEDSALVDPDPDNPANQIAGLTRRDLLVMGVSTQAGAIEVGARFLEQSKLLDTSGRARLVGYVEDDRGVIHPSSKVRAGDSISFTDAADVSYRRIVRAEYRDADKSCSVDLDSPPEGLQALLERLNVVLVPLGLGA